MIASGQPMHLRLRDCGRVQVGVRRRDLVVREPVEHLDRNAGREERAEVATHLEFLARPTAFARERRSEQHDRRECHVGRSLDERLDQERSPTE